MSGNSINFNYKKNRKKQLLQKQKKLFNRNHIDLNNILVSKKKYAKYNSFKHFIGYNNNDFIKLLYLELS